jgi:PIN domain nuclease of toxin-antitoxin system
MSNILFDTSAVLALINNEYGKESAEKFLGSISISSVNLSELYSKLMDYGINEEEIKEITVSVINKVIDFDKDLSLEAARLRSITKSKGLSLGDRACIATGIKYNLEIYTADKAWLDCSITKAKINLIR